MRRAGNGVRLKVVGWIFAEWLSEPEGLPAGSLEFGPDPMDFAKGHLILSRDGAPPNPAG